jgi:purine-nucleoside phosphorylase
MTGGEQDDRIAHNGHAKLADRLAAAADAIREGTGVLQPRIGLVLGSGLGQLVDRWSPTAGDRRPPPTSLPYGAIPGFATPGVQGHAGRVLGARISGASGGAPVELLALSGRLHTYEGHSLADAVFPVRALIAAGCTTVVLTNAAGGIRHTLAPGDLVLIRDHLNLMGGSPLRGPNDEALGPRFPDLSEPYDSGLRERARQVAARLGIPLQTGVYAATAGPQYETPAEIQMLRTLGADVVGMSTVPETIAANHMGAQVVAISLVTNLAAGRSPVKLSHAEVEATARAASERFGTLLTALLQELVA